MPHSNHRTMRPPGHAPSRARLLLAALVFCAGAVQAQQAKLTHAEAPAGLIRKTTVYDAPPGTVLYAGDILSADTGNVQLEWAGGVLVALGPGSRVIVDNAASAPALTLLRGWIKVAAGGSGYAGKLSLAAGPLAIGTAGNGILHLQPNQVELFVETGTMAVSATDKSQGAAPRVVGREQYAARSAGQPWQSAPRAPRAFIGAMPRGFFDPLVAVAGRVAPAQPHVVREVSPADVAALSDVPGPLRIVLAARFAPRLNDPAFRAGAAELLANRPAIRPAPPNARKAPYNPSNSLF
jgi:hypothetical protein